MSFFSHLFMNLLGDEGSRMLIGWPSLKTSMGKGRLPFPLGFPKRFFPVPTQTKFSPGLSLLGTPVRMLPGGDSRFPPPQVQVSFSPASPQFVTCMDEDRGEMNSIYWPKIHIGKGLWFPLPTLVHQFLHYTRVHPVHVHVNIV